MQIDGVEGSPKPRKKRKKWVSNLAYLFRYNVFIRPQVDDDEMDADERRDSDLDSIMLR